MVASRPSLWGSACVAVLCIAVLCGSPTVNAQEDDLSVALDRIAVLEQQVQWLQQPGAGCGSESGVKAATKSGTPLEAVYDGGLILRSTDQEKTPFELKFNNWFQVRHTAFDSQGPTRDQNDFDIERARLVLSGFVLTKDLQYYIQVDADDNQNQRLDLLDYYLSYDIGHAQFGLDSGKLGIRAGRWKVPFNRTRATSALNLQFVDRATSSVFFDIDRSVGVGLYGKAETAMTPVEWEFALINGIRTNNAGPDRVGDLDRNLGVSGRIFSDVLGEWGADFESDLNWHEELAVRLGTGFAFARDDIGAGPVEASRQLVVDSGARLTGLLPPGATGYSVSLFSASADFRWQGWSLSTEYYARNLSSFSGVAVPELFDHGFLLQTGYFLVPKKFEVFTRWARTVGDSGSLGLADASSDEVGGGAAWWIKGRNLKLVFDASHINGSPVNDSALGLLPRDDGMLYRTQFQLLF